MSMSSWFVLAAGEKDFKCPGNEARCATPVDGRFQCAAVSAFCDGARDCLDGSDEWDICDNCAYPSFPQHTHTTLQTLHPTPPAQL